jgi:hypothetical protein
MGLVIDKELFWSSFPMFILWLTKNGQCLSIYMAIMEPFWVVPQIKEKLYIGDFSLLFLLFYRKGPNGVWYYNLRKALKATSLGHPRDIEARPQYKER